jgi:hypothetical protein
MVADPATFYRLWFVPRSPNSGSLTSVESCEFQADQREREIFPGSPLQPSETMPEIEFSWTGAVISTIVPGICLQADEASFLQIAGHGLEEPNSKPPSLPSGEEE